MVVCHCNVVSDREIRAQVAAGALDADDIAERCRAGARCGGCKPVVEAILAEERVSIRRLVTAAA
jgi:bacterioferritin-associated ferredoxin